MTYNIRYPTMCKILCVHLRRRKHGIKPMSWNNLHSHVFPKVSDPEQTGAITGQARTYVPKTKHNQLLTSISDSTHQQRLSLYKGYVESAVSITNSYHTLPWTTYLYIPFWPKLRVYIRPQCLELRVFLLKQVVCYHKQLCRNVFRGFVPYLSYPASMKTWVAARVVPIF